MLFTIDPVPWRGYAESQIAVLDLRTNDKKVLVREGTHARYVPTGHLVYRAGEMLRAVFRSLSGGTLVYTLAR